MDCPQCNFANPDQARFCVECGGALERACPACGAGVEAGHKFCAACGHKLTPGDAPAPAAPAAYTPAHLAERILESRPAMEGERKQVTVLFADITGSTELIEGLDPEEAQRILDGPIAIMMDAVHRFEGTVNRVVGDGIMALFGAPLAHEDHAVRACWAALAMQQAARAQAEETRRALGVEVRLRVGLNSGEVVVGTIGNDLSMDYDVVGMTAHLASRMEQLALPGTIRLTPDTLRLAEGFVEVASLGPVPVKGVAEPLEVFELRGAGPARTRLQAAAQRGLTRFVGRSIELEALRGALEKAGAGEGRIVAVVAEPGVGKSRLFHEFTGSHRTEGWLVLESASVSYGKATPWFPVIDLLKSYFAVHESDDGRAVREKVTGKLLTLNESLKPILPALLSLFDLDAGDAAWQALDASQKRRRILDAVKALLLEESTVRPLIVVFEDLHWIDDETQALLDGLIDAVPTGHVLLLVNYRPEYEHAWGGRSAYVQLRIEPFAAAGAGEILSALLGDAALLAPLKELLMARSEGNALFLEESVRALAESGDLTGEPGAYAPAKAIDAIAIPDGVHAIIAARIDRLGAHEKGLLQAAAVIGKNVTASLLEAVAGLPTDDMERHLARLQAAELLLEARLFPDREFTFKHAATHEVAMGGLLHQRRRTLHAEVGGAIEGLFADRLAEWYETLAHHFEKAERWDAAAGYALQAAAKAKQRYAYRSAADFCARARQAAENGADTDGARRRAAELAGDVASLMGDIDTANRDYDDAITSAAEADRRRIENKRHRPGATVRDGATITYFENGSAADTLLFVNPIFYSRAILQPLVEALCQEFRIVLVNPRGTGASDPLTRPYTFTRHVEDTRAVIESLDSGPVTGVGISRGGNLLIRLAHAYPGLLGKIVTVGTPPDMMLPDSPIPRFEEVSKEYARLVRADDLEGLARHLAYSVFSEPGTEDVAESFFESCRRLPPETIRSFFDPDPEVDVAPFLGEIQIPILVTHGTADRQVPYKAAAYMVEHIPGARFYAFDGMGHLPNFTATREFCDVLRRFMRGDPV